MPTAKVEKDKVNVGFAWKIPKWAVLEQNLAMSSNCSSFINRNTGSGAQITFLT